jgi:serine-type D-Ala-D-Ala carboxypeptidase/endopeptidase
MCVPFDRIYWTQRRRSVFHIGEGLAITFSRAPQSIHGKPPGPRRFGIVFTLLLWGVLLLLAPLSMRRALAQASPLPQLNASDPFFEDVFRRTGSTGMVVVVVRGNERWMESYGQTYPGSHVKPNADSLVRLCSLTKIMTSDVLVKMVADGRVSLSDPLQKFAPRNVTVPNRTVRGQTGRPISLRDLATHTAGLPREIAYPAGGDGHFTFPDYSFRWQWLPGFRLRTVPGYAAHYSNIGYDLLADALSAAAHEPYAQIFAERIARPLGLRDTTVTPSSAQCTRLLVGGKNQGPCSDTTAAAGSGGMYSTANDMTRWLEYLLNLPGVPTHQDPTATAMYIPASELRWAQGLGRAGIPSGLGLGWVYLNEPEDPAGIIEKTGGGAGYTTYIALNSSRHIGIFVAATDGRHAGSKTAPEIFQGSNDLLAYLGGFTPELNHSLELAAAEHPSNAGIREATLHKHRKTAPRSTRQAGRSAVVTAGQ